MPNALQLLPPVRSLREPTWYIAPKYDYTLGPEVAEICKLAGYEPDPEQKMLLDDTFGVLISTGKSAAFEIDVVAARRNLKTGFIVQCILGWMFVTHEPKVMYTAQSLEAAQATWETVSDLIENTPALAAQLKQTRGDRPGIVEGNGRWAIILAPIPERGIPKRTVIFKTRGKSTGRALAGNKLVLDEAYAATARQVGSVMPILGAEPDPQLIQASSAGMVESEVLIDARDRGRAGGTARQVYAEWGDKRAGSGCELGDKCDHAKPPNNPPGCALDDESRWGEIMPALGTRVHIDTVRAMRGSMPPLEFAREFMVWWDVDAKSVAVAIFGLGNWEACGLEPQQPPLPKVIAVSRPIDLAYTSIAAAGSWSDGRIHVGAVRRDRGTSWVVAEVKRLQDEHDVEVVVDGKGPSAPLIPLLEDEGVRVTIASTEDVLNAWDEIYEAVSSDSDKTLTHFHYGELDDAVVGAATRLIGDRPAIGRKTSAFDPSMLEAATLAHYFVERASDYDVLDSILA